MPLLKREKVLGMIRLLIWDIREGEDFFLEGLTSFNWPTNEISRVKHSGRRLELLASRYMMAMEFPELSGTALHKTAKGKPFLVGSNKFISVSHSRGMAGLAVADHPVGIDILHPDNRMKKLFPKFTTIGEIALNEADFNHTIHLIWCAKEAVFKAYGRGGLDFKTDMQVSNLQNPSEDWMEARLMLFPEASPEEFKLYYRKLGELYLLCACCD